MGRTEGSVNWDKWLLERWRGEPEAAGKMGVGEEEGREGFKEEGVSGRLGSGRREIGKNWRGGKKRKDSRRAGEVMG